MPKRRIDAIVVGDRIRSNMGEIDALAASIGDIGLLHPIVITADGKLLAGQRRLEAMRRLGWTATPVRIVEDAPCR